MVAGVGEREGEGTGAGDGVRARAEGAEGAAGAVDWVGLGWAVVGWGMGVVAGGERVAGGEEAGVEGVVGAAQEGEGLRGTGVHRVRCLAAMRAAEAPGASWGVGRWGRRVAWAGGSGAGAGGRGAEARGPGVPGT